LGIARKSRRGDWLSRRPELPPTDMELVRRGIAPPKPLTRFERWFAPRQFLFVSETRTTVLNLSTRLQVTAAGAAAATLVAFLGTSFAAAWHQHSADQMEFQVAVLRDEVAFERAYAAADREQLKALAPQLARSLAERDRAAVAAFDAGTTLAEKRNDIDRLVNERTRLAQERDRLTAERDAALAANRELLRHLDSDTRTTIAQVERIIGATGLDMRRANLPAAATPAPAAKAIEVKGSPRGGPFVRWQPELPAETPDSGRIDGVTVSLAHLKALRDFISHVPLASPLPTLDITSGFSFRLDPFSRFAAMHEGVDMRAMPGTAVKATAAGRVVSAGWRAEYGNLVEIDHGFGILTRYAHLSAISVNPGDLVDVHQPIGLIGATGRTTGAHLHYEIRVDGQARNPVQFLKADRNLPKASQHVR